MRGGGWGITRSEVVCGNRAEGDDEGRPYSETKRGETPPLRGSLEARVQVFIGT